MSNWTSTDFRPGDIANIHMGCGITQSGAHGQTL